ncbi:MAG: hypothetical protein ACTTJL_01450 [Hoylesella enoeca]|uniref:hypothetical protein n=1 Tax=Hoylesella enoeca TaxID=76123 RepID=UPI003FA0D010
MNKQRYEHPELTVIALEEAFMDTISLPIGPGPSPGGGSAKQGYFDEDDIDELDSYSDLWAKRE